jgi:hypothetical protein
MFGGKFPRGAGGPRNAGGPQHLVQVGEGVPRPRGSKVAVKAKKEPLPYNAQQRVQAVLSIWTERRRRYCRRCWKQ